MANIEYSIWQLPISHNNCFRGTMFGELSPIKLKDYVRVYQSILLGTFNESILEHIFELLNVDHPSDYYARSLSVSDIVCCKVDGRRHWYYVDDFGFKELEEKEIK